MSANHLTINQLKRRAEDDNDGHSKKRRPEDDNDGHSKKRRPEDDNDGHSLKRRPEDIEKELDHVRSLLATAKNTIFVNQKKHESVERRLKTKLNLSKTQLNLSKTQLNLSKQKNRDLKEQFKDAEKTPLRQYLIDCHYQLLTPLKLAPESQCSTGRSTNVKYRRYPMWLLPWTEFGRTIHEEQFSALNHVFGDQKRFASKRTIMETQRGSIRDWSNTSNEHDADRFTFVAIETPVKRIFQELLEVAPALCRNSVIDFGNNTRMINQSAIRQPISNGSNQDPDPPCYPDGHGLRAQDGESTLIFVYDYKAAHKLTSEDLKGALSKKNLFMEVIKDIHTGKTSTDEDVIERAKADQRVAMALTQVYNYMLVYGVQFGFVSAGTALVLLHVNFKRPKRLYYHLCLPSEEDTIDESETIVAQLASFCSLALQSNPIKDLELEKVKLRPKRWPTPYWNAYKYVEIEESSQSTNNTVVDPDRSYTQDSVSSVPRIRVTRPRPQPRSTPSQDNQGEETSDDSGEDDPIDEDEDIYDLFQDSSDDNDQDGSDDKDEDNDDKGDKDGKNDGDEDSEDDDDNDNGPLQAVPGVPESSNTNKLKTSSSGNRFNPHRQRRSNAYRPPSREYCTQNCLLGLQTGGTLDEQCPNVSLHRTAKSGDRHPIYLEKFTRLVEKQLCKNQYRYCRPLDPYGLNGKNGSIGALFKIELVRYGYTFVAKGTQSVHLDRLQHESKAYSELENLQGDVVPAYLGIVNLSNNYHLPGEVEIAHMMLMSWAGEVATISDVPDLAKEVERSWQQILQQGVEQGDLRDPNTLWSRERHRVMLVDFDRATIRPVRHRSIFDALKRTKPNHRPKPVNDE